MTDRDILTGHITANHIANGPEGGSTRYFYGHKGYPAQAILVRRDGSFVFEGKGSATEWEELTRAVLREQFTKAGVNPDRYPALVP